MAVSLDFGLIRLFGGLGIGKVFTLSGVLGVVQGQEALFEVFIVSVAVGASLRFIALFGVFGIGEALTL